MSERKVQLKYIPPDFDPRLIPRLKRSPNKQYTVRIMAPYSMTCISCGEIIYKGRKFNAKKETALGEVYLGIEMFRFYIRCTSCKSEIIFRTDPKSADYVAELGATRNIEPERPDATVEQQQQQQQHTSLASLEHQARVYQREIETLNALEDIHAHNTRNEAITTEQLLELVRQRRQPTVDVNHTGTALHVDTLPSPTIAESTTVPSLTIARMASVESTPASPILVYIPMSERRT
jgi:hypothetical protein